MKTAVVYWSGTGNTETMANAVAEGAKKKGAEVTLMTSAEFDASMNSSRCSPPASRSWMARR